VVREAERVELEIAHANDRSEARPPRSIPCPR
jgi:hypothetical protein